LKAFGKTCLVLVQLFGNENNENLEIRNIARYPPNEKVTEPVFLYPQIPSLRPPDSKRYFFCSKKAPELLSVLVNRGMWVIVGNRGFFKNFHTLK